MDFPGAHSFFQFIIHGGQSVQNPGGIHTAAARASNLRLCILDDIIQIVGQALYQAVVLGAIEGDMGLPGGLPEGVIYVHEIFIGQFLIHVSGPIHELPRGQLRMIGQFPQFIHEPGNDALQFILFHIALTSLVATYSISHEVYKNLHSISKWPDLMSDISPLIRRSCQYLKIRADRVGLPGMS